MKSIYAILINTFLTLALLTFYSFISFSTCLTADHTDEWYGWAMFFGSIGLHIMTFTAIWKKSSSVPYILGLAAAMDAYEWVIYIYAIKPSGRLP